MRHQVYAFKDAVTLKGITNKAVEREFVRVTGGVGGILSMLTAHSKGVTQSPWTATGIKFQDGGTDWTVDRCVMKGFKTTPPAGETYWQGDGFATEHPNARIRFVGAQAFECGDAGFDLKGPDWRLEIVKAARNNKNYRFWSRGKATRLESIDPKSCHIQICISASHTEQQVIEIDHLVASGNKPLLYVMTNGTIPPKIIIHKMTLTNVPTLTKIEGPAPEIIWPATTT